MKWSWRDCNAYWCRIALVNADKKRISLQENRSNKFIRDGKEERNR
jgi:hypothetical protein